MNPNTELLPNKIKQFRNHWKVRVEKDFGIGKWCKSDPSKKPQADTTQYTRILNIAKRDNLEVKFTGKFAPGGKQFSIYEIWLTAIEIPWSLRTIKPKEKPDSRKDPNSTTEGLNKPPIDTNIPLQSNLMNITPSTEHKCPYFEVGQLETKYQQQYQERLEQLTVSEASLIAEKQKLTQELQQAKQDNENICRHWRVNDLNELSQKLSNEIREKDACLDERDYARQEATRLQTENQNYLNDREWYKGETNAIARKLSITNQEELDRLLGGQTLKQIIREREQAWTQTKNLEETNHRLATRHQVNTLKQLSEKLTATEEQLEKEKTWWNDWISEPDQLKIQVLKRDGANADYALEVWEQGNSLDLTEQPNSKRGRKNIQAIYKHYINSPTAEETSLTELDDEIGSLIGIDYTLQQIAELREKYFVPNHLTQTYNFIEAITILTNPFRINELERKITEFERKNLDENNQEELKAKANELALLLRNCGLPNTGEFVKNGFTEWVNLLDRVEEMLENESEEQPIEENGYETDATEEEIEFYDEN